MATPSHPGQKAMPGRNLDGQERVGLQQMWFDWVCERCGAWHVGGLPRSMGGPRCRDSMCPQAKRITSTAGPGPHQGSYDVKWRKKWADRPDDFTFDEVWGAGTDFAYAEAKRLSDEERARAAAKEAAKMERAAARAAQRA